MVSAATYMIICLLNSRCISAFLSNEKMVKGMRWYIDLGKNMKKCKGMKEIEDRS